jgi:hypothetical protein
MAMILPMIFQIVLVKIFLRLLAKINYNIPDF